MMPGSVLSLLKLEIRVWHIYSILTTEALLGVDNNVPPNSTLLSMKLQYIDVHFYSSHKEKVHIGPNWNNNIIVSVQHKVQHLNKRIDDPGYIRYCGIPAV